MADFRATANIDGNLRVIPDCWVQLGETEETRILLNALPEINDAKTAEYSDQPISGRSAPVKTYNYSSNRTIGFTIHLYVTTNEDIEKNFKTLRRISSLVHPEYNNTYLPPRIARLKCGRLLSDDPLGTPVSLKGYNISYPTDVQWFYSEQLKTYMPLRISLALEFDVIYSWETLPGADDVLQGRY